MRAVVVRAVGGPERLVVEDVLEPEPGEGEVRIRIEAAGVNFIDVYHRTGRMKMPLPFTPGMEAAGVVDAVGPGVEGIAVGDRVAHPFRAGAYAELQVIAANQLVHVPDAVSLRAAAAVMLQGLTAHYLTTSTFSLGPGHTVLVHAGAGGLGLLLTQVAVAAGATVLTTTSTEEKAERSRAAGASEVIRYDREDVGERVMELTDGRGVDVAYDSVGQATARASLASLTRRGLLVLVGESSGPIDPPILPSDLKSGGSVFMTRPTLGDHVVDVAELRMRAGALFGWLAAGTVTVHVGGEFALDEAAEAHRRLEARETSGKLLLLP
jgi:NADPH2:quinone reductase